MAPGVWYHPHAPYHIVTKSYGGTVQQAGSWRITVYSQIFRKTRTIALVQINNANRQQITKNDTNSTLNNAQLTSFPARTADAIPSDSSKRSHSKDDPRPILLPCIYSVPDITWKSLEKSGS
ncbi:hypothetical protein AVEN_97830-1 [Araneus ventricosus]|uniref:Uncharacterized protein n=1 Tax=Araneus ventricosus TaxID=182803 RepID=A0A4Y2D6H4_ARAVE|nr:hypothetical protein AVEN_97830-1 [Araneus ventricosus]